MQACVLSLAKLAAAQSAATGVGVMFHAVLKGQDEVDFGSLHTTTIKTLRRALSRNAEPQHVGLLLGLCVVANLTLRGEVPS